MSKLNYTTLRNKLDKKDALYLLETLHQDLNKLESSKKRAVIWAYDVQGLTFKEISKALFNSPYKQTSHNLYQKAKGGDR